MFALANCTVLLLWSPQLALGANKLLYASSPDPLLLERVWPRETMSRVDSLNTGNLASGIQPLKAGGSCF